MSLTDGIPLLFSICSRNWNPKYYYVNETLNPLPICVESCNRKCAWFILQAGLYLSCVYCLPALFGDMYTFFFSRFESSSVILILFMIKGACKHAINIKTHAIDNMMTHYLVIHSAMLVLESFKLWIDMFIHLKNQYDCLSLENIKTSVLNYLVFYFQCRRVYKKIKILWVHFCISLSVVCLYIICVSGSFLFVLCSARKIRRNPKGRIKGGIELLLLRLIKAI